MFWGSLGHLGSSGEVAPICGEAAPIFKSLPAVGQVHDLGFCCVDLIVFVILPCF